MTPEDAKLAARYPSLTKSLGETTNTGDEDGRALANRRYPSIAKDLGGPPDAGAGRSTQRGTARPTEPGQDRQLQKLAKAYPSLAKEIAEPARQDTTPERDLAKRRYPSIVKDLEAHQGPTSGGDQEHVEAEEEDASGAAAPLELEAPQGFDAKAPTFVEFRQIAGELGLDAPKANRLLELHAKALQADWEKRIDAWETATRSDQEIGGERLEGAIKDARAAMASHGTPELQKLLHEMGLGSHPEIIRLLARVARAGRGRG